MNLETNVIVRISGICVGASKILKLIDCRTNKVKNENVNLVTDCHIILARWRNHFSQLLNVHGVNYVRQTEIHTAEPQMPECLTRCL
jgi:hypothetical protein